MIDFVNILLFCGVNELDARVGVRLALECCFDDAEKTMDYAFIFSKRESARREYVADDDIPPLS
jgi:hypothetical protein